MAMAAARDDGHRFRDEQARRRARAAMLAMADGLTEQGLDIICPEWEETHSLRATNAWSALCEATITAGGAFAWDYRAIDGTWTDPAPIIAMTLALLGADHPDASALTPRYPGQTFKSAVGLAARACGMHARLAYVLTSPAFLEISADVEVTNPARPERGAVRINDTALRWDCQIIDPGSAAAGLDVQEITETIGRSVPQLRVLDADLAHQ
jgi:hypothetical protein